MAKNKDKIKAQLVEYLNVSPIISAACKKSGIGRATFYRWLDEDKDFAKEINASIAIGTESINDLATSKLIEAIKNGEPWALRFWLNNRSPHFSIPNKLAREIHTNTNNYISSDLLPEQKATSIINLAEVITDMDSFRNDRSKTKKK